MTRHHNNERTRKAATHPASVVVFCFGCASLSLPALSEKESVTLELKPSECVIMEQGQVCHVIARLAWTAEAHGDYCLFSSRNSQPLRCWNDSTQGKYRESLKTKGGVEYTIRRNSENLVLAREKLTVTWVYRESVRPVRQWRLF